MFEGGKVLALQHIKSINIEKFKCFNTLSIPSFEQVNLIGGKNNVGKTSLLEAIELLCGSLKTQDLMYQIQNMLVRRQESSRSPRYVELDFMYADSQYLSIQSDQRKCEIKFEERQVSDQQELILDSDSVSEQSDLFLSISINGEERKMPADGFLRNRLSPTIRRGFEDNSSNVNYIKSSKTDEHLISLLYGALVDLNKEDFLNNSLSIFDENLLSIKQRATDRGVTLKILKKDRKHPVLLSSLGDGVNRYIAILCAIWASQDGVLLVDEIENGIHYSNYGKLWKLIFKAAEEANCQLFITSHSKECIEAFNHHQSNDPDAKGLYFELFKSKKDGLIKASARTADQLTYALSHGGEIRGE